MEVQGVGQMPQGMDPMAMRGGEKPGDPLEMLLNGLSEEQQAEVKEKMDSLTEEQKAELREKMGEFRPHAMENQMSMEEVGSTFLQYLDEIYNSGQNSEKTTNPNSIMDAYV